MTVRGEGNESICSLMAHLFVTSKDHIANFINIFVQHFISSLASLLRVQLSWFFCHPVPIYFLFNYFQLPSLQGLKFETY